METLLFDQNVLARFIMTLVAVTLCIGPAVADFNETHATNPNWPGHARFHVVWQVLTNSSICLVLLYLLWVPVVQYDMQLRLVGTIQAIILGSFYITLLSRHLFGGTLKDENGIKPFRFKLPGRTVEVDTNLFGFSINTCFVTFAIMSIAR